MLSGEGFELGALGLVELGFVELGLDGFGVSPPTFAPWPWPLTVSLSTTRRLPANDCAIRSAVCRSLPLATEPDSSMLSAETMALMRSLASVGSRCSAVWIWLCSSVSLDIVLLAPVVPAADDCGMVLEVLLPTPVLVPA